jgi:predicted transcriptional regulator
MGADFKVMLGLQWQKVVKYFCIFDFEKTFWKQKSIVKIPKPLAS